LATLATCGGLITRQNFEKTSQAPAARLFATSDSICTASVCITRLTWLRRAAEVIIRKKRYDHGMEPLHISEGDLARDVRSILQQVETGTEVIVERNAQPVAVIRQAEPVRRTISECIALMPAESLATIDPDFAKDVEAAIAAHREPLEPPAWD
jgi:hypothetical protein